MPTYQYACTACGHRFEAVQSFSDSTLTECPECTGRLRKVFSSVGIVFKGSGFYRTDSRSGGRVDAAASSDSSGSGDSSSSSGSSDSGSSSKTSSSESSGPSSSSTKSSTTKSSTTAAKAS